PGRRAPGGERKKRFRRDARGDLVRPEGGFMIPRVDKAWVRAAAPPALAVALVAAMHFFVFQRGAAETQQLRARAGAILAEQTALSQGTQQVTEWLRVAGGDAPDQAAADTLALASAIPSLLQRIADLSQRHGVRVFSIRPDAPGAPIQ